MILISCNEVPVVSLIVVGEFLQISVSKDKNVGTILGKFDKARDDQVIFFPQRCTYNSHICRCPNSYYSIND